MDAPAQMIRDKLSAGILPRQDESKTYAGYGSGAPCAGCDLAVEPTDIEHELVFADGRAFAFHLACVNLWRALKDAPAEARSGASPGRAGSASGSRPRSPEPKHSDSITSRLSPGAAT